MWTAVNHFRQGILAWVLGDHSAETFKPLWDIVCCWQCYFYVTDGWKVYPSFIEPGDHIVSKTYMTSSSPSELGGVKGKGEGGKVLNPLTFPLSPFPRPHLASLGWQTTSLLKPAFLLFDK